METWMRTLWMIYSYSIDLLIYGYLISYFIVLALAYLYFRLRKKLPIFRAFIYSVAALAVFVLFPVVFILILGWWISTGIQLPMYWYANPQYYTVFLLMFSGLVMLLLHRFYYRKHSRVEAAASSFFWGVLIVLFGSFAFALDDRCNLAVSDEFHAINQHIKDLCLTREDTSECPLSLVELRAFRPEGYEKLRICSHNDVQYTVDPDERTYHFSVKVDKRTFYANQDEDWGSTFD